MAHGDFIWADLSSIRTNVTRKFYSDLLGWTFDDYAASLPSGPVAGLFEMPAKFQAINMPSFWMSYIAVDDVAKTVEIANKIGGKVELGPVPYEGGGEIALIRDPLGAGFTVYTGTMLDSSATGAGAKLGPGLFVSDASKVTAFYSTLFGWSFKPTTDGAQEIQHNGKCIAHLYEIPDEAIRGKEQYWAVYFGTSSLADARKKAANLGGEILAETEIHEGNALIVRDPDGGTFWLLETGGVQAQSRTSSTPFRWKAWLGFFLMLASVATESTWPWVIFLGIWTWRGLKDRATYLFESVTREDDPLLYWMLMITYGALTVLALMYI